MDFRFIDILICQLAVQFLFSHQMVGLRLQYDILPYHGGFVGRNIATIDWASQTITRLSNHQERETGFKWSPNLEPSAPRHWRGCLTKPLWGGRKDSRVWGEKGIKLQKKNTDQPREQIKCQMKYVMIVSFYILFIAAKSHCREQ